MIATIENTDAYKQLEGFKQTILMKRDNRLRIEEEIVTARNAGLDAWHPPAGFPTSWAAIVREIITDENK